MLYARRGWMSVIARDHVGLNPPERDAFGISINLALFTNVFGCELDLVEACGLGRRPWGVTLGHSLARRENEAGDNIARAYDEHCEYK